MGAQSHRVLLAGLLSVGLLWGCNGTETPDDAAPGADLQSDGGPSPDAELQPGYYLRGATLITGTGQPPQRGLAVVVRGKRIVTIEPEQSTTPPKLKRLDLDGLTLLPGLIDSHVHVLFAQDLWPAMNDLFKYGVTTVQDLGAPLDKILELREELRAKPLNGPRLVVAGPLLSAPEGHPGGTVYVGDDELIRTGTRSLVDAAAARREVAALARAGVDLIKVVVSDCSTFAYFPETCPRLDLEVLRAICDAARAHKLRVVAHTDTSADVRDAVVAGVNAVTHGVTLGKLDADLPDLILARGTFYVPTLDAAAAYTQTTVEEQIKRIGPLHEAGVQIVASTDAPNPGTYWGSSMQMELIRLVQGGFTPKQALAAGTRVAAEHLGQENEIGTIEPGKIADLMVVRGDPLDDITALGNVRLVMHDGVVVYEPESY